MLKLLVMIWLWMILKAHPEFLNLHATYLKQELLTLWREPAVIMGAAIDVKFAIVSICIALLLVRSYLVKHDVYLVDFVTYTPPEDCIVTSESFCALQRRLPFSKRALEFMDKLIVRTGLGENTYFPRSILRSPPDSSLTAAREEAEMVMFGCLDELFATTNTKPRDVDILVVNCSLFNPTPSLSAMVVNKYKMREDVQSYNLSGMGCSAGVIAVHLAKDLLNVYPNSLAVVMSTENITQNWYKGNERGMLVSNCLFRLGGAAILLSNKSKDAYRAKYKLLHTVRTNRGADDASYGAVFQDNDCEQPEQLPQNDNKDTDRKDAEALKTDGNVKLESTCRPATSPYPACHIPPPRQVGVRLSKDLMKVAGDALKHNITSLAPLILPWTEQLKYLYDLVSRKVWGRKSKPYVPNFKEAIQHFCIHAGGRAVIEAIEEALALRPQDVEPSKATLFRFGNTSSASIWYELAFIEKHGRIKQSEKVWQIAFGSGFKCNSAVWQAL